MTTRYTKKYVVTVTCDLDDDPGDFAIDRAVRDCLSTLSHKRFKLPQFRRADIEPLRGVRLASVNLAEAVAESIEEGARSAVWSHEDDYPHDRIDDYC